MKTKFNQTTAPLLAGLLTLAAMPWVSQAATNVNHGYLQVNLVSDLATNAHFTDPQLVNPWGIVAAPEGVWVNNNEPGLTKVYSPAGRPVHFAIHVPAPNGTDPGTPTGLALNRSLQFVLTNATRHAPSVFLMATEDGAIAAWNRFVTGTNAVIVADNSASGAVYKGLDIARDTNGAPKIYAANFHSGMVDVFDEHFNYVSSFTDPGLPSLFAPFNVRTFRGRLFVTFAKQRLPDLRDDDAGPGNGFVDIFDTDGTLLRRFASGNVLNSPWGMAIAPANFGKFSHALLVGNFGDGKINAYDLLTGKVLGHLIRPNGDDLVIDGLWGLTFERDERFEHECDFHADRLYFTAGIQDEAHGLLGIIRPVAPFAR